MNFLDFIINKKYGVIVLGIVIFVAETVFFYPGWWQLKTKKATDGKPVITQSQTQKPQVKLSLQTKQKKIKPGESFAVEVVLDANNQKTDAVDVILKFDPAKFLVEQLMAGQEFPQYPLQRFDNNEGRVFLSATTSLGVKDSGINQGLIGTVIFKALGSGTGKIEIEFRPEATTDSNVIISGGITDALTTVENLEIMVE